MVVDERASEMSYFLKLPIARIWDSLKRYFTRSGPDIGMFAVCGSYYPQLTYADELWDHDYVEACQELDAQFPCARLLPERGWSLGLSKRMIESCQKRMLFDEKSVIDDGTRDWLDRYFNKIRERRFHAEQTGEGGL